MLLHAACRILCSSNLFLSHKDIAKNYLRRFFQISPILYGLKSCTSNLHGIIHLTDDIDTFNCNLTPVSAFHFENCLGNLKKKVRTSHKPLTQVCRRLEEEKKIYKIKPQLPAKITIINDDQGNIKYFKVFDRFVVKDRQPNNCVILKNGSILYVTKIFAVNESVFVSGVVLKKVTCAYSYPMHSNKLGFLKIIRLSTEEIRVSAEEIANKMILTQLRHSQMGKGHFYAISLLH